MSIGPLLAETLRHYVEELLWVQVQVVPHTRAPGIEKAGAKHYRHRPLFVEKPLGPRPPMVHLMRRARQLPAVNAARATWEYYICWRVGLPFSHLERGKFLVVPLGPVVVLRGLANDLALAIEGQSHVHD